MKKKLFALLVGIDNYSSKKYNLQGCVNDLNAIKQFLIDFSKFNSLSLEVVELTNESATRKQIIDGFKIFDTAQQEDICLFYYSGHGSQVSAPPEFWHLESDKLLETLVCYDSRLEDGKEIVDKELTYLIWKANKNKKLPFVVIMDCCHAGTNVRNEFERVRKMTKSNGNFNINDLLGIEDFDRTIENGQVLLTPPMGNYIHLAASESSELAKEISIHGQNRGVFTYNLIEGLKQSKGIISNQELIAKTKIRIQSTGNKQSPQLEISKPEYAYRDFLSGEGVKNPYRFLTSFNRANGWHINIGAIHGLEANNSAELQFVLENGHTITGSKVLTNFTKVTGMDAFSKYEIYKTGIKNQKSQKTKIAILPENEMDIEVFINKNIEIHLLQIIEFVKNPHKASLLIRKKDQKLQLLDALNYSLLLEHDCSHSLSSSIDLFMNQLIKIVNWRKALTLSNTLTSIQDNELEIKLYEVLELKNEKANKSQEKDLKKEIVFPYRFGNNNKFYFRLEIINTSQRGFWISAVLFDSNYEIKNSFLPKEYLNSGDKVAMFENYNGIRYQSIPISNRNPYQKNRATFFIKIFVSTVEFDTNDLNQPSVIFDNRIRLEGDKGIIPRPPDITKPDWTSKEIRIIGVSE